MAREADPEVRRVIARNLRRALGKRAKGVVTAAADLKMPQSQLSGYLRGHRGFSIETLLRLSVGLGCSLDDLVVDVNLDYTAKRAAQRHPSLEADLAPSIEYLRQLAPNQRAAAVRILREFTLSSEPSFAAAEPAAGEADVPTKKRRRAS